MNFYLKEIKGQSKGGLCKWARSISKLLLYIYILDIFLFSCKVLESGECQGMISQASSCSMCVNTAMEYSSNKPEERAEHILC